jgi:hypothetical protein
MLTKILLVLGAATLLPLACSSGAEEGDAGANGGKGGTPGAGGAGAEGGAPAADGGSRAGANGGSAGTTGVGGAGAAGAGSPDGGSDAGGSTGGQDGDDALIFPAGLEVTLEPGGAGVLDLYALTLRDGAAGLELYAALTNDGDVPACDAALQVTLYDTTGQPLGMFINGLDTMSFYLYTLPDASTTIAACAKPGEVAMTEIATMATDISVADVGQVVYDYRYFALDAVLVDGLTVTEVNTLTSGAGATYTGTVVNELDMAVTDPSIRVFPLNHVGRPLGVAKGGDASQVAPGDTWTFQTDTVDAPGVSCAAFPSASF